MAVYRPQYKDKKTGKMQHTKVWYYEFVFAGRLVGGVNAQGPAFTGIDVRPKVHIPRKKFRIRARLLLNSRRQKTVEPDANGVYISGNGLSL